MYLHSSKEDNYEIAASLGLSDKATAEFKYAAYEVALDGEITEDGKFTVYKLNGVELKTPVIV